MRKLYTISMPVNTSPGGGGPPPAEGLNKPVTPGAAQVLAKRLPKRLAPSAPLPEHSRSVIVFEMLAKKESPGYHPGALKPLALPASAPSRLAICHAARFNMRATLRVSM
jgi:hypothetical protein